MVLVDSVHGPSFLTFFIAIDEWKLKSGEKTLWILKLTKHAYQLFLFYQRNSLIFCSETATE